MSMTPEDISNDELHQTQHQHHHHHHHHQQENEELPTPPRQDKRKYENDNLYYHDDDDDEDDDDDDDDDEEDECNGCCGDKPKRIKLSPSVKKKSTGGGGGGDCGGDGGSSSSDNSRKHLISRKIISKFCNDIVGKPVNRREFRKCGQYILGPKIGQSPVNNLAYYLARKEGTNQFFQLNILMLSDEIELTDNKPSNERKIWNEKQGKMLMHTEFSMLTLLKGEPGIIQQHGLFSDMAYEEAASPQDQRISMYTGKIRKRVILVLDNVTPHEYCKKSTSFISLQQYLLKVKQMPEIYALKIFLEIIIIVEKFHKKNIIHRDLKLANIILNKITRKIIIIKFCLGKYLLNENELLIEQRGSPAYTSPDILNHSPYKGKPSDMWALGVVLFMMFYGEFPFFEDSPRALFDRIRSARYTFPPNTLISEPSKQLVRGLLQLKPENRLTATMVRLKIEDILRAQPRIINSDQSVPGSYVGGQLNKSKSMKLQSIQSLSLLKNITTDQLVPIFNPSSNKHQNEINKQIGIVPNHNNIQLIKEINNEIKSVGISNITQNNNQNNHNNNSTIRKPCSTIPSFISPPNLQQQLPALRPNSLNIRQLSRQEVEHIFSMTRNANSLMNLNTSPSLASSTTRLNRILSLTSVNESINQHYLRYQQLRNSTGNINTIPLGQSLQHHSQSNLSESLSNRNNNHGHHHHRTVNNNNNNRMPMSSSPPRVGPSQRSIIEQQLSNLSSNRRFDLPHFNYSLNNPRNILRPRMSTSPPPNSLSATSSPVSATLSQPQSPSTPPPNASLSTSSGRVNRLLSAPLLSSTSSSSGIQTTTPSYFRSQNYIWNVQQLNNNRNSTNHHHNNNNNSTPRNSLINHRPNRFTPDGRYRIARPQAQQSLLLNNNYHHHHPNHQNQSQSLIDISQFHRRSSSPLLLTPQQQQHLQSSPQHQQQSSPNQRRQRILISSSSSSSPQENQNQQQQIEDNNF